MLTDRKWPVTATTQAWPNVRCLEQTFNHSCSTGTWSPDGDFQAGAAASPVASGQPFEKPQMQMLVFRYTAQVAVSDSTQHAAHDGRRPVWFVAVRWPRQAGLTRLTQATAASPNHKM